MTDKREFKSFPIAEFKVLDTDQGVVEAIVAVFNKPDYEGDVIEPGFFAETIASGKLPKGWWQHQQHQPVAVTLEARELMPGDPMLPTKLRDLGGLYVKGRFNLNTQRGREAFEDVKFGTVDEFSFGYITKKKQYINGNRHLISGLWFEWSPVTIGMHPDTAVIAVKGLSEGGVGMEFDVKGMFDEMLRDRTFGIWNLFDVLQCTLWRIDDLQSSAEAAGTEFDYEGQVRQALSEFMERVVEGMLSDKEGSEEDEEGAVGTKGARLGDGRGLSRYLGTVGDAVAGAISRTKARRELRHKEGRMLSAANEAMLADISKRARALADEIDELVQSNAKEETQPGQGILLKQIELKEKMARAALGVWPFAS